MGRLEVITGPMFSGKSEELIRRLTRAKIARQQVLSYKPSSDTRYHHTAIASHSQRTLDAYPVEDAIELHTNAFLPINLAARVVGIDEGQFFDRKLIDVCEVLIQRGARVVVAGLDTDFRGLPFDPMPELMALADEVVKLTAICMICGEPANHTYRMDTSDQNLVSVGAKDQYQARCRGCFSLSAPKIDQLYLF